MLAILSALLHGCSAPGDSGDRDRADGAEWTAIRDAREQERQQYIQEHEPAYRAFAHEPLGSGGVEGLPLILFRLLPELDLLAPGEPVLGGAADTDAWLASLGYYVDERFPGPLPIGFAFTRPVDSGALSIVSRTCGGCHTGRVRVDGQIRIVETAGNAELTLHQYSRDLVALGTRHLTADRIADTRARILELIDAKPPGWFFEGAISVEAEAAQREAFKLQIDVVLATVQMINDRRVTNLDNLLQSAYSSPDAPDLLGGPPGFMDSSGLGLAGVLPKQFLPTAPAKNDAPPLWRLAARQLAEWDARFRGAVLRNVTAGLGPVGDPAKMDLRAQVLIAEFLDDLPPAVYPFASVDLEAAARGEKLFERHCEGCHAHTQIEEPAVMDLGTDMTRAGVVRRDDPMMEGSTALATMRALQKLACPPGTEVEIDDDGVVRVVKPCEQPADLPAIIDRTDPAQQGYVAGPLDGVWARAPYLHNGSVPTMRHLLVPSLRANAAEFVRGSLSYDEVNMGWAWEVDRLGDLGAADPAVAVYDTAELGSSSAGHDRDVTIDGTVYRLAWDDPDDAEVNDLIEYLKTL